MRAANESYALKMNIIVILLLMDCKLQASAARTDAPVEKVHIVS